MPAMTNAHALLFGISQYQFISRLPETVLADAGAVAALLADPALGAYAPANVRLLPEQGATAGGIRQALGDLARASDPEATLFVYVSCHGGRVASGPQAGEYLLPVDARLNDLPGTAIAGEEFTRLLHAIPARKLVVVLDTCHAGGIGQIKGTDVPAVKGGLSAGLIERLSEGVGRVILASSRPEEESWILPGDAHSLFTKHLLAGMQGGVAAPDGLVRIFDLFEYLQPRVTAEKAGQHPRFKGDLEENFPVCLYRGGLKGPAPEDAQGKRYDVYINYAESSREDEDWVWDGLLPHLQGAGLKVATSEEVQQPGVARVVSMERGVHQSRYTLLVLSDDYFRENSTRFLDVLAQSESIREGDWRVIPLIYRPMNEALIPSRLGMLGTVDLTHPRHGERRLQKLVGQLKEPAAGG